MNIGAENGYFNGVHCYMKSSTESESKNCNSTVFARKRDEIAPNRSKIENSGLQYGFEIDVMLPASTLHQYDNME